MRKTRNILSNQRGVSLIELIVVMGITVIMVMISGSGVAVFFRKFDELKKYAELQNDAIELINYIKFGIPMGDDGAALTQTGLGDYQFRNPKEYYGVNNAVTIQFLNAPYGARQSNAIRVIPTATYEQGLLPTDYADFYYSNGAVRCRRLYKGEGSSVSLVLFPKIGKQDYISLDEILFRQINAGSSVKALEVTLRAKVEIGPKRYKHVNFRTQMVKK
ncbi:MAG TPA: hypothetical protein DCQ12_01505 [Candidatus Cloacimonas sp.]|jgi:prepilin-type N-terminal cleavage/methylation domain-containing protein|nr:hypothetical protein [Candidatus Cloacimonas sp.]